jgi:hypothetical protein
MSLRVPRICRILGAGSSALLLYFDPDTSAARVFGAGLAWPTTAFYTREGRLNFAHQGAYATQAKLASDIQRYAING